MTSNRNASPSDHEPDDGQPGERRRTKRVEYKVTLTSAEHAQLIALRDTCRLAGQNVGKAALLRAAVSMLNHQSSKQIADHLQLLPPLTAAPRRKAR